MIILQSTDKLQILLGGTPTVEATWYAAYADHTATTFTPNLSSGVTTGATAVDVVGSPAASTQRQVKYVSIYNGDAATITVTARVSHNGTFRTLAVITLPAGSRIEYTDGLGWGLDDRTNKQPLDATLSAIAALPTGADQLPYFTGTDTAAQTSLTSFARSLLGLTTGAAWVSAIGAASSSHTHDAADVTSGVLAVARGGTGIGSYTTGNFLSASGATTLQQRTPAQVLSDIGAAGTALPNTFTAAQNIAPASGNANIDIRAPSSGNSASFVFRTGTLIRWWLQKNETAETGSNAGSDFVFQNYSDAGSVISNVVTLVRATGYARIPGVYAQTTASGANVFVDSSGNLMRSTSSMRYKTGAEPIAPEYADKILELDPIWYRSLCDGDNKSWSYYGLSAEQVAEIIPQLAQYETTKPVRYADIDEDGNETNVRIENEPLETPKPNGIMYDRFTPLLINIVKRQKQQIDAILARLEKLEATGG